VKALLAVVALFFSSIVSAQPTDYIELDGDDYLHLSGTNASVLQNDDPATLKGWFYWTGSAVTDYLFDLAQSTTGGTSQHLNFLSIRNSPSGALRITEGVSTSGETTATISGSTWYAFCVRMTTGGSLVMHTYNADGTTFEDETISDATDPANVVDTDDLNLVISASYAAATDAYSNVFAGRISQFSIDLEDILEAGCDRWVLNPRTYDGAINKPDYFASNDLMGRATISGTLQDKSGAGRNLTLVSDPAIVSGGPPLKPFMPLIARRR
jgi:hypothetical protein